MRNFPPGTVVPFQPNGEVNKFCVLTYQIALERETNGGRRWHCTRADAAYRGEDFPDYQCKHIQALRGWGRQGVALLSGSRLNGNRFTS